MSKTKAKKASLWVKPDGTQEGVFPAGAKWTLPEMQAKVGGYIELVGRTNLEGGQLIFADEDGLMKKLPANTQASVMAGKPLVGNVLVVPKGQVE